MDTESRKYLEKKIKEATDEVIGDIEDQFSNFEDDLSDFDDDDNEEEDDYKRLARAFLAGKIQINEAKLREAFQAQIDDDYDEYIDTTELFSDSDVERILNEDPEEQDDSNLSEDAQRLKKIEATRDQKIKAIRQLQTTWTDKIYLTAAGNDAMQFLADFRTTLEQINTDLE